MADFCPQHPDYEVGSCRPCQIHAEKVLDGWSESRLAAERLYDLEGWEEGEQAAALRLLLRQRPRAATPSRQGS